MLYNILYLFLLFFIYSVLGYIIEVIAVSISLKKLSISRGFLIGPYIPIYGVGIICMTKLLAGYKNDLLVLFIMSVISCTILEYLTSYLMEKLFKLRWWDYSHLSFNINGRVCLINSVFFGIGGILVTKIVNPFVEKLLLGIPKKVIIVLGLIALITFIVDIIISLIAIANIKIDVKKYAKKDATDVIKKEISNTLNKYIYLKERLIRAFPNAKAHVNFTFATYKEILDNIITDIKKNKKRR